MHVSCLLSFLLCSFWILPGTTGNCPYPAAISHSGHNASSRIIGTFHENDAVLYHCEFPYTAVGNPLFTCRHGQWFNYGRDYYCRLLTCSHIEIEHGTVIVDSYDVGSEARIECDRGYEPEGSSSTLICLSTGRWSYIHRLPTCNVTFCPELPERPHLIRFQASDDGAFNDYLSVVTNRCEESYQLVGSVTNICQADKTWSGEPASCERINCGHPNIGNGTARILSHTFYAGMALVECNPGHMLVGGNTTTCTENGWVGGYCYGNCTIGPITHGLTAASVLREGDVLQWQCVTNGYAKYPGDRETVCQNETLVPPPQCRLIEYGPEGCPPETDGIKVTRQGDTCFIFHLTWPSSYHTALETCRNHCSGGLLTIRNSTKMEFVASVLSGLGMKTDYDAMSHLDRFNNEIGTYAHKMAWLGLFYSDQWRWPALLGEPVSYTRWRAGEGGISWWGIKHEKCAALNGGHGWWWDDVLCGSANYVVCEAPAFQ